MDDIWEVVLRNIDRGSDYKSVCLVSRQFNKKIKVSIPTARSKFANHLLTLLKKFPDKSWNWDAISKNPNITWEFIQNNTCDSKGAPIPWNWNGMSRNPNITWEIIQKNTGAPIPWNWNAISINPSITWEIIADNPDASWNWKFISANTFGK